MQKQKKQFFIVCVILLICIGVFFGMTALQKKQQEKEEAAAEAKLITVNSLDIDTIDSFTYQYAGTELTFEKKEDTWYLATDHTISISQSMISSMLLNVAQITAKQQITAPEGLSEYGLDTPQNTITLKMGEDTMTVTIGDYNAITSQYYLMVSGSGSVYLVEDGIYTAFQKSVEDLTEVQAENEAEGETKAESKTEGETEAVNQ